MFFVKLDFMMRLTECKNSSLANSISVDPSHISRLRNGKRKLSKNENFLRPMIKYFIKHIDTVEKIMALESAVGIDNLWKTSEENIEKCIYEWFNKTDMDDLDSNILKSQLKHNEIACSI